MKQKHLAIAVASLFAAPLCVHAQSATELGEISVYGERPAAFRNITTTTEAATRDLIDATNVINTEDVVKYLPSIQVRKRYIGDRNAILASRNSGTIDSARSLVYADNVLVSMLLGNSFSYAPRWWFVAPQ
ncbi:MAG: Plug domain-containing protein, partial [Alphaproteobacteria bacterium]|nr:Plug domain-containing protein [Alphaproteobacteria bacterium]